MARYTVRLYIAGKVSRDSVFGKHHWRDEFCVELSKLSGIKLENLEVVRLEKGMSDPWQIFAKDCQLISQADVFIVNLTDDISVGGSQEILIARYLRKPVIGLAPKGGKFNGRQYQMPGYVIEDYKDPFVYSTCDKVCETMEEVALAVKSVGGLTSSGLEIIDNALRS